jgi:predicted 3-demethylubiquinone-9 3-methyltransferase (glyoxalase superfamily)
MSLYVRCDRESDVDKLYAGLTEGGQVLMPLGEYPFSRKYAWVNDKYGVSWQISLEGA